MNLFFFCRLNKLYRLKQLNKAGTGSARKKRRTRALCAIFVVAPRKGQLICTAIINITAGNNHSGCGDNYQEQYEPSFYACKGTEGKSENKKLLLSGPSESKRPNLVYEKTLSLLSFTSFSSLLITFDRHIKLYSPGIFDCMIVLINTRLCIY